MSARGMGDGQEQPAGAVGGVDMNAPATKEMIESLISMGISKPEAEMVSLKLYPLRINFNP